MNDFITIALHHKGSPGYAFLVTYRGDEIGWVTQYYGDYGSRFFLGNRDGYLPNGEIVIGHGDAPSGTIIPLSRAEAEEIARKGGWIRLHSDDLHTVEVEGTDSLERELYGFLLDN